MAKPEARKILLFGDGELTPYSYALAVYWNDDIVLCDFSDAGAYVGSRWLGDAERYETVRIVDVLAENPFAAVEAPGSDYVRRQVVEEAKAKTSIELLAYITRRCGHF